MSPQQIFEKFVASVISGDFDSSCDLQGEYRDRSADAVYDGGVVTALDIEYDRIIIDGHCPIRCHKVRL